MQVRGRHLVIAWTVVFLAAVSAIVLRTKSGFAMRSRVDAIEAHIKTLGGLRGDLEAQVATLKNRTNLAPKAQAFGLRFTSDSQFHRLPLTVKR